MGSSRVWAWLRIAGAIVAFSGVVAGFIVNFDRSTREGWDLALVLANYFSLFTIITAILTIVVLLVAAFWSMRNPGTTREPFGIALGLAIISGPLLLLGIVYNVLLRGPPSGVAVEDSAAIVFADQWAAATLHVVLPLYLLIDLLFAPRRRGLPWWALGVVVAYPVVWVVYTMVRGTLVANPDGSDPWWYPYPFLDPNGDGGYASSFTYIAVMTVGLVLIGVLVIAIGRYRERRAARREETVEDAEKVVV